MARCGHLLHIDDNGDANNLLLRLVTQRIVILERKVHKEMIEGSSSLDLAILPRTKRKNYQVLLIPNAPKGTCFRLRYSLSLQLLCPAFFQYIH